MLNEQDLRAKGAMIRHFVKFGYGIAEMRDAGFSAKEFR